ECGDAGDHERARMQAVELLDQVPEKRTSCVELERPSEMVGDLPEVAAEVRQQVPAGSDQHEAAEEALGRDHANDAPAAARIARVAHANSSPLSQTRSKASFRSWAN